MNGATRRFSVSIYLKKISIFMYVLGLRSRREFYFVFYFSLFSPSAPDRFTPYIQLKFDIFLIVSK